MSKELKRAASRLKEMLQFGVGETFEDRFNALRENASDILKLLPFVPFGEGDSIRCWPFPSPGTGFDVFFLICKDDTAFPTDPRYRYRYEGTRQTIFVLDGDMWVDTPEKTFMLEKDKVFYIEPNTPVRVRYKDCMVLFKITPKIDLNNFFFE